MHLACALLSASLWNAPSYQAPSIRGAGRMGCSTRDRFQESASVLLALLGGGVVVSISGCPCACALVSSRVGVLPPCIGTLL